MSSVFIFLILLSFVFLCVTANCLSGPNSKSLVPGAFLPLGSPGAWQEHCEPRSSPLRWAWDGFLVGSSVSPCKKLLVGSRAPPEGLLSSSPASPAMAQKAPRQTGQHLPLPCQLPGESCRHPSAGEGDASDGSSHLWQLRALAHQSWTNKHGPPLV